MLIVRYVRTIMGGAKQIYPRLYLQPLSLAQLAFLIREATEGTKK